MKRGEMKLVLFVGFAARAGVIDHLAERKIPMAAVVIRSGDENEPIRRLAEAHDLPVIVSSGKAEIDHLLLELAPDLILSVGWPLLFGQSILEGPWMLLNAHPTLLPKYRGRSPWANIIENGEKEAGVTIHEITENLDAGPILHQEKIELSRFDTYRSLRSRLLELEPIAAARAIEKVIAGDVVFSVQDESQATSYLEHRTPEHSKIDPNEPLSALYDKIRASDPESFPAFFYVDGQKVCVKLWRPMKAKGDHPETL